jgi:mono/diheme cytochrome c family protein
MRFLLAAVVLSSFVGVVAFSIQAQQPHGDGQHGTPQGWKFTWPKGDPVKGREAFVKLECYSCHQVKGEAFPAPGDKEKVGPDLSMMGPLHDADYFAEAIINPTAVIEKGKGYEASDGSSKMPSFNDSLTVQELIDLVAFLRELKPPAGSPHGQGSSSPSPNDGHQRH